VSSKNELRFTGDCSVLVKPIYTEEDGLFIEIMVGDEGVGLDRGDTRILADYLRGCLEEE
jgi:hypothetical protein